MTGAGKGSWSLSRIYWYRSAPFRFRFIVEEGIVACGFSRRREVAAGDHQAKEEKMLVPEINWYFDGTVQEQVKERTIQKLQQFAADWTQLIYAEPRRHQEEASRGENCLSRRRIPAQV
jgi:hypothetical protein